MKQVYYVCKDPTAEDRQSDGVEFCIIPRLNTDKIYFYCSEYMLFWESIEDAGDMSKTVEFKAKRIFIRPATLPEICSQALCDYITTIK